MADNGRTNAEVYQFDHAATDDLLTSKGITKIGGAIFNLGYLPGTSKEIVTKPESTLKALSSLLSRLKINGIIVLVVYYGHPGGTDEKEAVLHFCQQLDQKAYHVLQYSFINQKNNPPFLIAVEKRS